VTTESESGTPPGTFLGAGLAGLEDRPGVELESEDSRAGDPQLHMNVVVLNRVQTLDSTWRTLDSRALFKAAVGLSELYNRVISDYLTTSLGWGWQPTGRLHPDVPKYEVARVPAALAVEFSQRSTDIEARNNTLVAEFVARSAATSRCGSG
jgi:conjugative relaxase-like TrwC/TraI family protein